MDNCALLGVEICDLTGLFSMRDHHICNDKSLRTAQRRRTLDCPSVFLQYFATIFELLEEL